MNVIGLMSLVGVLLAGFFAAFFLQQTCAESGSEQDALLPLNEEEPSEVNRSQTAHTASAAAPLLKAVTQTPLRNVPVRDPSE